MSERISRSKRSRWGGVGRGGWGKRRVLRERLCCDSYPRWMALTEPRIYFSGELRGKICYSLAFPSFSHCSTSRSPYFILTPPIPKQIYLQAIFNQPTSSPCLLFLFSFSFFISLSVVRWSIWMFVPENFIWIGINVYGIILSYVVSKRDGGL